MKIIPLVTVGIVLVLPQVMLHAADAAATPAKPNVVYLMADDLGWSDISEHPGGSIPTPHVDRFFKEGVELTNFMGWCVCSPTRAMLLTGRHPFRVGTGPETGGELEKEETTIAEGFKANGYRTGIFGKWHNGENPGTPEYLAACKEDSAKKKPITGFGVNVHGFDEAWVYYGGGGDYFNRRNLKGEGPVSWWHNLEYRPNDVGYTDDFVTARAVDFIRDNKDRPFFCYVPFHIVHTPLQAKDSDLAEVDAKVTDKTKRIYSAMVQAMDKNVATILAELDRLGLRDNTIVVFTSDNGATADGTNVPFRGTKHTLFEGGTHLPTAVRWPNGGLTGGRSWDGLCGALDMFPTLMAMADLKMPATRPLDGLNFWPALRGNTVSPVKSYYWSWHSEDAIRTVDWRMHRFFDHNELFDMHKDIAETTDVAKAHPEVVKTLNAQMNQWADSLGAVLTHQRVPARLDAKPAPAGDVLQVKVTVTDKAAQKDRLLVPFASTGERVYATDCVEFDILVAPGSLRDGFYYTPFRSKGERDQHAFLRGQGIDQFGRDQTTGPEPKGGPGIWEHRVIGLSSMGPEIMGQQGLIFEGKHAGTFTVYLDNLRVRHADGSTTPVWIEKKDIRTKAIEDTKSFKNVQVNTVDASTVLKK